MLQITHDDHELFEMRYECDQLSVMPEVDAFIVCLLLYCMFITAISLIYSTDKRGLRTKPFILESDKGDIKEAIIPSFINQLQ